jgi:hypothetical protein
MLPKIIITDFDKWLLSFCRNAQSPSVFSEAEPVEAGDN